MFKMKKVTILIASLLAAMLVISACGNGGAGGGAGGGAAADGEVSGPIVVGGWPAADEAFEAILPMFNELYPDVEVEILMSGEFRELLITSFAAGSGAPDVVMLEGGWMGELKESPALENLYDEPFDGGRFADAFVDFRWEFAHSADGSRLVAIPWDIGPATLFYRADIFEEVGLPSDPDEVYALLSTWDGWLAAAEAIHIPGERWIMAEASYLATWHYMNRDFFNERLELQLTRPGVIEALEAAIIMRENGWDAQAGSMWSTEAEAGLATGGIATSLAGCWYGGFLKSWISPDNVGNWRITRLPGGLPDSNWGGSFVGIPTQSENPLAAWAFIEFSMTTPEAQNTMFEAVDYFPALISAWDDDEVYNWGDPYFGGQRTRALWVDIARNIHPVHTTMMDSAAEGNFGNAVSTGLAEGMSPQEIMDFAYEFVMDALREQRQANIDMLRDAGLWDDSWE